jgi:hypothetical protein
MQPPMFDVYGSIRGMRVKFNGFSIKVERGLRVRVSPHGSSRVTSTVHSCIPTKTVGQR